VRQVRFDHSLADSEARCDQPSGKPAARQLRNLRLAARQRPRLPQGTAAGGAGRPQGISISLFKQSGGIVANMRAAFAISSTPPHTSRQAEILARSGPAGSCLPLPAPPVAGYTAPRVTPHDSLHLSVRVDQSSVHRGKGKLAAPTVEIAGCGSEVAEGVDRPSAVRFGAVASAPSNRRSASLRGRVGRERIVSRVRLRPIQRLHFE
jgi:hypothetical protein